MTKYEKKLAAELLRRAASTFSNHGCNDFEVEGTAEDCKLFHEICDDELGRLEGDYWEPTEGEPFSMEDWILMCHLADKMEEEDA